MSIDLLIKNGLVVNSEGRVQADVAISKDKILGLARPGVFTRPRKEINAEGMLVLPGCVDSHSHISEPFQGCYPRETWELGTKAAAIGGTTTVIGFATQTKGKPLIEKIRTVKSSAGEQSVIDFHLHAYFSDFSDMGAVLKEIPGVFETGITSFKAFTIYTDAGLTLDDWSLYQMITEIKKHGGFLGVHAENAPIGENLQLLFTEEGKIHSKYWPMVKPHFVEVEAIKRVCGIAEFANGNLYIVHTSTKEGAEIIGEYRKKGLPIYSETCPHYLNITDDIYAKEGIGTFAIISPPFRKQTDVDALWRGLANGSISIIGTDHCAFETGPKKAGYKEKGFIGVPNGGPGVLETLSLMYSEGVLKKRITLERMVEVTSTNASKMFGLYPQKGTIAPGSDADIVIFDPNKKQKLGKDLYEGVDWSWYEGREVTGFPTFTILRGDIIVQDNEFVGQVGGGKFVFGKVNEDIIRSIR